MMEIDAARVGRLAYLAAAVNLAACVAMLLWLRPGLPLPSSLLAERFTYVTERAGAVWWAGWLIWCAAAISLISFYLGLARIWWGRGPLRCGTAMVCAAAGLAADLSAEAIYMGLAPSVEVDLFSRIESFAALMTGGLGNGLYTLAGILLMWAGAGALPRQLLVLGGAVWICGLWLSVASFARWPMGQLWSTTALMPLFVTWCALVGRWLRRPRS